MSFSAKILEKFVKLEAQTLKKQETVKNDAEKKLAIPPETRKWRKIKISDNPGHKYLSQNSKFGIKFVIF